MNELEKQFGEQLEKDILFSSLTTLGIGGPITYFLEVKDTDQLSQAITTAKAEQIPYLIIGGGSNLLVSDEGFDGLVIKMSIQGIEKKDDKLIVQSGTKLEELVDYTIQNNIGGFNHLIGIPGTVGGAVYGKIAAYGDDITDYLEAVACFDGQRIITLSKDQCDFGYRDSAFKQTKFTILSITFNNLQPKDSQTLKDESAKVIERRLMLYPPTVKCPGSFFKNTRSQDAPENIMETLKQKMNPEIFTRLQKTVDSYGKIPSGALLEDLGAQGDQINQIQISKTHANTFINLGNGTAEDFYSLAKKYYLKVKSEYGLDLEPEVQFVNLPTLYS